MLKKSFTPAKPLARQFFKHFFQRDKKVLSSPDRKIIENSFGKYEIVSPWAVSEQLKVPSYIPKPSYHESGAADRGPEDIDIKNENEIECMHQSCILARNILNSVRPLIKPGNTTDFIDREIHELIINNGAYPSPLNYHGYPKSICTSVNNVACHGIPDSRPLHEGDILNVDITVYLNGYHGDCSEMFTVGQVDSEAQRLIQVTEKCLNAAISLCKPDENFSALGAVIEETANKNKFSIVPVFAGHGIGKYFHGPPDIYHCANDYPGKMRPGMTFTIEPVLSQGEGEVEILDDGWTAITTDNSRTAQIEHTILITNNGCKILTQ